MVVTFWILFVFFGFLAVQGTLKLFMAGHESMSAIIWVVSIIVTALGAGMLFGDLDEEIFGKNIVGEPSSKVEQTLDAIEEGVKDTVNEARKLLE